jgi:outer membrane biosynthesis protein TonB
MHSTAACGLMFLVTMACGSRQPTRSDSSSPQSSSDESSQVDAQAVSQAQAADPSDVRDSAIADDGAGMEAEGDDGLRATGYSETRAGQQRASEPRVTIETTGASVVGDLDKSIVRRYLRRHIPRLRYCYEKQLLENPELEGALTIHFEITPQGLVEEVEASGLHPKVNDCVSTTIRAIQFPIPNDGGSVRVTYPFTFTISANH